ncbi:MAG: NUDIX domain-containing protein [Candidatus Diapherotrites archaeon]|nr:NUDIX domain-containing protein [Candidatus Diapherotrites archaeon]
MDLLIELFEEDIFPKRKSKIPVSYNLRKAARAVLVDSKKQIALLHVAHHNFWKLPGGGIEQNETILEGLVREVREEVGCGISKIKELGETLEFRNQTNTVQVSYCFLGKASKPFTELHLEDDELADGMNLHWVSLTKAISLVKNSMPSKYEGHFIKFRDLAILQKAKTFLK